MTGPTDQDLDTQARHLARRLTRLTIVADADSTSDGGLLNAVKKMRATFGPPTPVRPSLTPLADGAGIPRGGLHAHIDEMVCHLEAYGLPHVATDVALAVLPELQTANQVTVEPIRRRCPHCRRLAMTGDSRTGVVCWGCGFEARCAGCGDPISDSDARLLKYATVCTDPACIETAELEWEADRWT